MMKHNIQHYISVKYNVGGELETKIVKFYLILPAKTEQSVIYNAVLQSIDAMFGYTACVYSYSIINSVDIFEFNEDDIKSLRG